MKPIEGPDNSRTMPFALRPLEERDIPQSAEVESDAFPSTFPPTSFRRELVNKVASYLVAWRRDDLLNSESRESHPHASPPTVNGPSFINRLAVNARQLWQRRQAAWEPGQQFLVGFLGIWYVADEAHIVSVGVRSDYRGEGIGELLLIGAFEQAVARRASVVTLEVRVSNHIAKNLYLKYGFKERGRRKGYYTDNREDAIIMTTEPLDSPARPEQLTKLVRAHEARWGQAQRVLG